MILKRILWAIVLSILGFIGGYIFGWLIFPVLGKVLLNIDTMRQSTFELIIRICSWIGFLVGGFLGFMEEEFK